MFRLGSVRAATLVELARAAEDASPTYSDVGATLTPSLPTGFHHDRYEVALPNRPDAFERGAEGLRQWAAHREAGLTVEPHEPPAEGATVAIAAPVGPLTAVAICRIVAVVDVADCYGFAYGTLPGHPEQGEEAFVVVRGTDGVKFRVVAFSKPAEMLARLGGPLTRAIQQATSRRYLDGLVSFVTSAR
jgi:uncharacterized protein (UPF0548 family)